MPGGGADSACLVSIFGTVFMPVSSIVESVWLYLGLCDDLTPERNVLIIDFLQVCRRPSARLHDEVAEPLLDLRRRDRGVDFLVEALDDGLRCLGRRHHAVPGIGPIARHATFGDGRHVRQEWVPLG